MPIFKIRMKRKFGYFAVDLAAKKLFKGFSEMRRDEERK